MKKQVTHKISQPSPQGVSQGSPDPGQNPGTESFHVETSKIPIPEPGNQPEASGIPVWDSFSRIVKTSALTPNPRNPNEHPEAQLRLFIKILKKNGWRRSIVVSNRSGLIVRGHGAWLSAQLAKLDEVPVTYQDYPTAEAELEDLVADNELARMATTNEGQLREILKDLERAGEDLELTGILKRLEDQPTLKELEIKPPPKMAWVLIGVPLVKYASVNKTVEKLAEDKDVFVESCISDQEPDANEEN